MDDFSLLLTVGYRNTSADECFQFTADSMGYRNTSADGCFWFTADGMSVGYRNQ